MKRIRPSGREPQLGGKHAQYLTGMEPALSREFGPLYGPFRQSGLEAPPVMGRRRPLVVLAEPDDSAAELVVLLAGSNGYEVRRTADGREAWRMIHALEPNLIVVKKRLLGLNGLEMILQVRKDPNKLISRLPILVMDVHHHRQDVLTAFEFGADDYLMMPYDVSIMLSCWSRVTAGFRRPAPLTALLNQNEIVRWAALSYLLEHRSEGMVTGLIDLLYQPDPSIRSAVCWALRTIGTREALSALERSRSFLHD